MFTAMKSRRLAVSVALSVAALAGTASPALAHGHGHAGNRTPLALKGSGPATSVSCDSIIGCISLSGTATGTPFTTALYQGEFDPHGQSFSDGKGGVCELVDGDIKLTTATPAPGVVELALKGVSCSHPDDSRTTFAGFHVTGGTGPFANARGCGFAKLDERGGNQGELTLTGSLTT
jgi:hypothetical protein